MPMAWGVVSVSRNLSLRTIPQDGVAIRSPKLSAVQIELLGFGDADCHVANAPRNDILLSRLF